MEATEMGTVATATGVIAEVVVVDTVEIVIADTQMGMWAQNEIHQIAQKKPSCFLGLAMLARDNDE